MYNVVSPYPRLNQKQGRHRNGLAEEDGRYHLAAAPFDFLFIIDHALSGRQHIVDDDNLFPLNISHDTVIPFEYAVLAALGLVQARARLGHIHIVQPRCQLRPVLADIPVEAFEASAVFYPVATRHEHDMIGLAVQLQCGHARLEELDAVYLSLLELVERTAERPLLVAELVFISGRVVMSVKGHPDAVRLEGLERVVHLEQVGTGKTEHPAGIPMAGQHSHAVETVAQLFIGGRPCGSKRHLCGFPSPETNGIQQPSGEAEQDQAQNIRIHSKIR